MHIALLDKKTNVTLVHDNAIVSRINAIISAYETISRTLAYLYLSHAGIFTLPDFLCVPIVYLLITHCIIHFVTYSTSGF